MPVTETEMIVPACTETGKLNIMQLKRYWWKSMAKKAGTIDQNAFEEEWPADVMMLSILGLGLEQTIRYVFNEHHEFEDFEEWILGLNNGYISPERIKEFNDQLTGKPAPITDGVPNVLTEADMAHWDEHGYVILKGAVPKDDCEKTVELICKYLEIDRNDPATWYKHHKDRQGIMVQLFQHEQLQKNRDSTFIRQAYEQLWSRKDILVNTDRVGFNPPETETYKFPGPKLHWDVSLAMPMPFGTQGILYLADTAANQGAFTLIPGFNNTLESWLKSLPPGANPRTQDLYALNPLPIAAEAGDFILWHQALPHGSSPNTHHLPRFVQYINYQPIDPEIRTEWI